MKLLLAFFVAAQAYPKNEIASQQLEELVDFFQVDEHWDLYTRASGVTEEFIEKAINAVSKSKNVFCL